MWLKFKRVHYIKKRIDEQSASYIYPAFIFCEVVKSPSANKARKPTATYLAAFSIPLETPFVPICSPKIGDNIFFVFIM